MNIYEAIGSIIKKGVAVKKDSYNMQQKFKYRGIDEVMNTFQPLMAEAGIFLVPEVLDAKREERLTQKGGNLIYSVMRVKYTFYAEDGSSVSAVVVGEGMDSGDKASNKAMAVAMKYAMFQVFCIPTEEMRDPDAETPEQSAPKPEPKPVPKPVPKPAPDVMPEPMENEDGYYICKDCGDIISGKKLSNGQILSPKEVAVMGLQNCGAQLCFSCGKARMQNR